MYLLRRSSTKLIRIALGLLFRSWISTWLFSNGLSRWRDPFRLHGHVLHKLIVVSKSFNLIIIVQRSYVANYGLIFIQLLQSQVHLHHDVILVLKILFELVPFFLEIEVCRGAMLVIANQCIQLLTSNLFGTRSSLRRISNVLRIIDCCLLVVGPVVSLGILMNSAENLFELSDSCVVISKNGIFPCHL